MAQTVPKHAIMFCGLISGRDHMIHKAGTNNYRLPTESPKALKALMALLLKSGLLGQFLQAVQLLYEQ